MTWEVTQWERSDLATERGRQRKAAIMWCVKASAVGGGGGGGGLRHREGGREGRKREERGRSSLRSLPVETQAEMEGGTGKGRRTPLLLLRPPRTGDVKLPHKQPKATGRSLGYWATARLLTGDTGARIRRDTPSWHMRHFIFGAFHPDPLKWI